LKKKKKKKNKKIREGGGGELKSPYQNFNGLRENTLNFNEVMQEYFPLFLTKPFCQWHVMRFA